MMKDRMFSFRVYLPDIRHAVDVEMKIRVRKILPHKMVYKHKKIPRVLTSITKKIVKQYIDKRNEEFEDDIGYYYSDEECKKEKKKKTKKNHKRPQPQLTPCMNDEDEEEEHTENNMSSIVDRIKHFVQRHALHHSNDSSSEVTIAEFARAILQKETGVVIKGTREACREIIRYVMENNV